MSAALQYFFASLTEDHGHTPPSPREDAERARDEAWIAALHGNDVAAAQAAFEAMFAAYGPPLERFAHSYVRDTDVAQDIVVDVFFNIWERRTTWTPEHGAAVYLYGAVRNRAHNATRTALRQRRLRAVAEREATPPGMGLDGNSPDVTIEHDDVVATVWRAIAALPEPRRQAVILRWHHGMSAPDIARILGVSQGAVYQLLNRAHALLRELLGPSLG